MTDVPANWSASWLWSLPLIALTVLMHSFGLFLTHHRIVRALAREVGERTFRVRFGAVMGMTVLLVTGLHGAEAAVWAAAYRMLDALPDAKSAMLYSLEAMTTYGHENIRLDIHWRMMGALEALNGMMLFGLTTAYLFSVLQSVLPISPIGDKSRR